MICFMQVYVGQPAEFPAINKKAIVIEPGREHFLSLNTQIISANKKIKSLTPEEIYEEILNFKWDELCKHEIE